MDLLFCYAVVFSAWLLTTAENWRGGGLGRVRCLQQQIAGEQLESGVQCSRLLLLQDIILQPWIHGVGVCGAPWPLCEDCHVVTIPEQVCPASIFIVCIKMSWWTEMVSLKYCIALLSLIQTLRQDQCRRILSHTTSPCMLGKTNSSAF